MKLLTTTLFLLIAFGVKAQDSAQVKIDTIPVYIVIENPATDKPQDVLEGIAIREWKNGQPTDFIIKKLLGYNKLKIAVYADVPKNEFITPISKK